MLTSKIASTSPEVLFSQTEASLEINSTSKKSKTEVIIIKVVSSPLFYMSQNVGI